MAGLAEGGPLPMEAVTTASDSISLCTSRKQSDNTLKYMYMCIGYQCVHVHCTCIHHCCMQNCTTDVAIHVHVVVRYTHTYMCTCTCILHLPFTSLLVLRDFNSGMHLEEPNRVQLIISVIISMVHIHVFTTVIAYSDLHFHMYMYVCQ